MTTSKNPMMKLTFAAAVLVATLVGLLNGTANAARIRDVARLQNEIPDELVGFGLVVGLNGTGDGGEYLPAMRPLKEMMKRLGDPVTLEKDLKNSNNVAIVSLTVHVPAHGAHIGDRLDVEVHSIGAAKSLKGGTLFYSPLLAPLPGQRMVVGSATGTVILNDETVLTSGTVRRGGTLVLDLLPDVILDGKFSFVLNQNMATMETATAVADRINEEVSAQTDGQPIAVAMDATSVDVVIPMAERKNVTPFISRLRTLVLPHLSVPAKVTIDRQSKTIVFTDEVEIEPITVTAGGMTVTIGPAAGAPADTTGARPVNASMQDLENAFNLLKVGPDDRIKIVELLYKSSAINAELDIQ